MPSLAKILEDTMYVTAALGKNAGYKVMDELEHNKYVGLTPPFKAPPMYGAGKGVIDGMKKLKNAAAFRKKIEAAHIWHWRYPKGQVREIKDVTCRVRSMHGMKTTVCDKIVFHELRLKLPGRDEMVVPLELKYELGRTSMRGGEIFAKNSGLWQLRTRADLSFVNVLGYELRPDGTLHPLSRKYAEALESSFMPDVDIVNGLKFKFNGKNQVTATVGNPRFIVALSLVTCRERNNCEPSETVGAARIYPQVMMMGNVNAEHLEATIEVWRPKESSHAEHHDDMEAPMESLLFTDRNLPDAPTFELPTPRWEKIFDYYHLKPHAFLTHRNPIPDTAPEGTLPNETCVVDRKSMWRKIGKAVSRFNEDFEGEPDMLESELKQDFYSPVESIEKYAGQGEFDNLHLAPHMREVFEIAKSSHKPNALKYLEDIVMAPFCVHDCLHTHFRWGDVDLPGPPKMPKSNRGWNTHGPHEKLGGPLVPTNQSVYLSLPAKHAFRYRAVAHRTLAGHWTVFNHHGSYYATGAYPGLDTVILNSVKSLIDFAVEGDEPWTDEPWGEMTPAEHSWAALYWRLRFGGYQNPDNPQRNHVFERLTFNLRKCMQ